MRNLEYHAACIVYDLMTKPKHQILIAYKPLADMVEKMIKIVLESVKTE